MTFDSLTQNQEDTDFSALSLDRVIVDIFERGAERASLSPSEEADLLARAKDFDQGAAVELIYAYAPLLRNVVGKATLPDGTQRQVVEDMRTAAVSAVWEAIAAYIEAVAGPICEDCEHESCLAVFSSRDGFAGLMHKFVRRNVHDAEGLESPVNVPWRTLKRFYSILEKDEDGDVYKAAKTAPEFGMSEDVFLSVAAARYLLEMPEVVPAVHDDFLTLEEHDLAHFALRSIDGLERDVAELRHGFRTGEEMTFPAITDALAKSDVGEAIYQRKVERYHVSGLEKMRAACAVTNS